MKSIRNAVLCLVLGALAVPLAPAAAAPPAAAAATVSGTVFGDANSNGRSDAGEGVNGLTVRLFDQSVQRDLRATTGSSGRFSVEAPRGQYFVSGRGNGWVVVPQFVTVRSADLNLTLRAVRPLGKVLQVGLTFDRDVYAPSDDIHVTVTVTNTGSSRLYGITAACARIGDPNELHNTGPEWGPLQVTGPGLVLEPDETRVVEVTTRVPSGSQRAGIVFAACDFGYQNVEVGERPVASDSAEVPGQFGAIDGDIRTFPNGHNADGVGVAGARLVVVDPATCPVLTKATVTDAQGHFQIGGLPAGPGYQLYVYPPSGLRVRGGNPNPVFVFGRDTNHFSIEAVPGTAEVPDPPSECTAPSTPPTDPSSPPLASTGAGTDGLADVGILAFVLGAFLVLISRRRRHVH